MQAIVLAGGLGTRLRSVVPDLPKPMAPVAGRPFLAWLLDALAAEAQLGNYLGLHLARAEALRQLSRAPEAGEAYQRALALADNTEVHAFIQKRMSGGLNGP